MLADTCKHDPATDGAPLALYSFPEISSSGKMPIAPCASAPFIGGSTLSTDEVMIPLTTKSQDSASAQDCGDEVEAGPDIEALETAAFNNGLEKGRAEGRAEATEELKKTVENAASALNAALTSLEQVCRQNLQRMETETVRLALAIAKKVIGTETEKPLVIQHVVRMAMEKVTNPRHLVLRLNPADIEAITAIKSELIADDADMSLSLQPDSAIQRGGCIIETQLGDVDARIDQQIKMIETLLTDKLPRIANGN